MCVYTYIINIYIYVQVCMYVHIYKIYMYMSVYKIHIYRYICVYVLKNTPVAFYILCNNDLGVP